MLEKKSFISYPCASPSLLRSPLFPSPQLSHLLPYQPQSSHKLCSSFSLHVFSAHSSALSEHSPCLVSLAMKYDALSLSSAAFRPLKSKRKEAHISEI